MSFSSSDLLPVNTGTSNEDGNLKHWNFSKLPSLEFGESLLSCVKNLTSSKIGKEDWLVIRNSHQLSPLLQVFEKPVEKQYSLEEVSNHCDSSSCWIVLHDKIYDVTEFLSKHPGGPDIILENAGRDATVPFQDKGHSQDAMSLLDQYFIGDLIKSDHRDKH